MFKKIVRKTQENFKKHLVLKMLGKILYGLMFKGFPSQTPQKVKCPKKEKKEKETKYTLAFHAEGKNSRDLGINRNYFMACNPWHGIFGMEIRASYAYSMYHPQHGNHSMEIRAWSLTAGLSTAWKSRHGFFKACMSPHGCPRHFLSTA